MENNELDLVVFQDDEGNEITMEVLDYFFYEGEEYALLAEADDEASCEECEDESCENCQRDCYIMKVVPVGEDEEEFVPVSEDLADKLIEIVQSEVFYDDDEFDDEEE